MSYQNLQVNFIIPKIIPLKKYEISKFDYLDKWKFIYINIFYRLRTIECGKVTGERSHKHWPYNFKTQYMSPLRIRID